MSIPPPSGPEPRPQPEYQPLPQPLPQAQPQHEYQHQPGHVPYGYPYWGQGYVPFAPPAPVNGVAIAALVLGLLCFLPAVGLVLGIIALVQIRKRGERGRGMAIAGAVLSSLGLALWAVSLSTSVASEVWAGVKEGARDSAGPSLVRGDCFDVPGAGIDDEVSDVDRVPCADEHDGEVFGVVRVGGEDYPGDDGPGGDGPGDDYPGDAYVSDKAEDECRPLQDVYSMDSWARADGVDIHFLTPTKDSWSWGDREITCVFTATGTGTGTGAGADGRLTGSLRSDASTLNGDQLAFLKALNAVDTVLYEEPEDYPEKNLAVNRKWAGEVADVMSAQVAALNEHTWPAGARGPVAGLVKEMKTASGEWAAAAGSRGVDGYYEHYENGYGYVDGDSTVDARAALGLATTPPAYDAESDGSGDEGGLDV